MYVVEVWQGLAPFLPEPLLRDQQGPGLIWTQIPLAAAASEADVCFSRWASVVLSWWGPCSEGNRDFGTWGHEGPCFGSASQSRCIWFQLEPVWNL